jgi:hypothetical protein
MLLALQLKCQLYGPLWYSDAAIPLIFLTLGQYEAVIGTPNPGYSARPLLMMMQYCLALLGRSRLRRYCLVLAFGVLISRQECFRCNDVESRDAAGGILCSHRAGGSTNCA